MKNYRLLLVDDEIENILTIGNYTAEIFSMYNTNVVLIGYLLIQSGDEYNKLLNMIHEQKFSEFSSVKRFKTYDELLKDTVQLIPDIDIAIFDRNLSMDTSNETGLKLLSELLNIKKDLDWFILTKYALTNIYQDSREYSDWFNIDNYIHNFEDGENTTYNELKSKLKYLLTKNHTVTVLSNFFAGPVYSNENYGLYKLTHQNFTTEDRKFFFIDNKIYNELDKIKPYISEHSYKLIKDYIDYTKDKVDTDIDPDMMLEIKKQFRFNIKDFFEKEYHDYLKDNNIEFIFLSKNNQLYPEFYSETEEIKNMFYTVADNLSHAYDNLTKKLKVNIKYIDNQIHIIFFDYGVGYNKKINNFFYNGHKLTGTGWAIYNSVMNRYGYIKIFSKHKDTVQYHNGSLNTSLYKEEYSKFKEITGTKMTFVFYLPKPVKSQPGKQGW